MVARTRVARVEMVAKRMVMDVWFLRRMCVEREEEEEGWVSDEVEFGVLKRGPFLPVQMDDDFREEREEVTRLSHFLAAGRKHGGAKRLTMRGTHL